MRVANSIKIESVPQTFVTCTSKGSGCIFVRLYGTLYKKHNLVATNGIIQVDVDKPFKLLIAHFGIYPVHVPNEQVVAELLTYPKTVTRGPLTIVYVLGIEEIAKVEQKKTEVRRTAYIYKIACQGNKRMLEIKINNKKPLVLLR